MPSAKYSRRSQRNRRREGSAKYVAPAVLDPTAFNNITVTGAGTPAANGVYIWDSTLLGWAGGVNATITPFLTDWVLNVGPSTQYKTPLLGPIPPETGWTVDNGTAPVPTLSYTS